MGLLYRLKDQCKTISIVGMAKNAGKTTTLNYAIEEAYDEDMTIGLTSSGRDGESSDVVTGSEKPKIFAFENTLVSTPVKLYELADAGLEILKRTGYSTPLGDILICKVRESGYLQIAGPLNVKDHRAMCAEMLAMGSDMILVDGAIDRKSIASPGMADGVILATGAVLGRSIKSVVDETAYVVNLYSLPELSDDSVRTKMEDRLEDGRILLVEQNDRSDTKQNGSRTDWVVRSLDLKTGLGAGRYLDEAIGEDVRYVYLPGALTLSVISDIHPQKYRNIKFIVKDPTKIFVERLPWKQLVKKGFQVEVLKKIRIVAITVNPYSPLGWHLDPEGLRDEMQKAVPEFTVTDVKRKEL